MIIIWLVGMMGEVTGMEFGGLELGCSYTCWLVLVWSLSNKLSFILCVQNGVVLMVEVGSGVRLYKRYPRTHRYPTMSSKFCSQWPWSIQLGDTNELLAIISVLNFNQQWISSPPSGRFKTPSSSKGWFQSTNWALVSDAECLQIRASVCCAFRISAEFSTSHKTLQVCDVQTAQCVIR
jgi:hypothetical protein